MPSFHTKTIESILDPVAQQVSKLIILHEEAEDGSAMPDLQRPVEVVKMAILNLVKVGHDTINSSNDVILKQEMPPCLKRVEEASVDLQAAADLLSNDPYSFPARKKLIDGSRGILQGTSNLLLAFDSSEVRKIIRTCKNVLDVLAITEVVDKMDQLVDFVKGLSPCLSRMAQEVDSREKELTHHSHSEMLARSLEKVKSLTPILISSIKMYITNIEHGDPRGELSSQSNRDYIVTQMSNEIQEIIRVLQLTSAEDTEWYDDDLAVMRSEISTMDNQMDFGNSWLTNSQGLVGSTGEKACRAIIKEAGKLATICALPEDKLSVEQCAAEAEALLDQIVNYRLKQQGDSSECISKAKECSTKLQQLRVLCDEAATRAERHGIYRPARTLEGKLSQAQRWLSQPGGQHRQTGVEASLLMVAEGKRLVEALPLKDGQEASSQLLRLCHVTQQATNKLNQMIEEGVPPTSKEVQELALSLSQALMSLRDRVELGLVERVAENLLDIHGPLKQLAEAAMSPTATPDRENIYEHRGNDFQQISDNMSLTADMIANNTPDKQLAETLRSTSNELKGLAPQLVEAGRLVLYSANTSGEPTSGPVLEHFELLKKHWTDKVEKMRCLVDEATDIREFIQAQENGILRDTEKTEQSIQETSTNGIVEHTSNIARRANRVLQMATQEAANSEDSRYVDRVNDAVKILRARIGPMVMNAKSLVSQLTDQPTIERWRSSNQDLISAVGTIKETVTPQLLYPPQVHQAARTPASAGIKVTPGEQKSHDVTDKNLAGAAAVTHEISKLGLQDSYSSNPYPMRWRAPYYIRFNKDVHLARPETPETDIDEEFDFPEPQDNQPILAAAHALHQEAKQWSSRDNEIIAAAKRMASLMAQLSQIVRGETGSKKELIDVAKSIADASEDVTRCAKLLARECTDKRMRTTLLQMCEKIPTIGTQLKILSTVKATMLGTQGSDEDQEATEMLVGNAQNLMQCVVDTVHAAESASIKIRIDSGFKINWTRRSNWLVS